MAWNNLTSKTVIYNYGNEVIWNNSNIRVDDKTIIFKNWQQSGIKYVKDMFDNDRQSFYTFAALKEKFDLPSSDFLKYLSILNSLPNALKRSLKNEDKNIPPDEKFIQMLKQDKLTNSIIYKIFMQKQEIKTAKPQQKWNETFLNSNLNWKAFFLAAQKSTIDIKLRNFQYKHLMRIIPTNQFLTKCHITSSTLCDFCNMEIETFLSVLGVHIRSRILDIFKKFSKSYTHEHRYNPQDSYFRIMPPNKKQNSASKKLYHLSS